MTEEVFFCHMNTIPEPQENFQSASFVIKNVDSGQLKLFTNQYWYFKINCQRNTKTVKCLTSILSKRGFSRIIQPFSPAYSSVYLKQAEENESFHFTPDIKNALFVPEENRFKPEITFYFSFCFSSQQNHISECTQTYASFFSYSQIPLIFQLEQWTKKLYTSQLPGHTSTAACRNISWKSASIFPYEKVILTYFLFS